MRIAIQISGEFRFLKLTADSFMKQMQDPGTEIDFFIHTWKKENTGCGTIPFPGRGDWHNKIVVFSTEEGLNLYKPKAALVEDYEEKKDLHILPRGMSEYYSMWKANEIRKEYQEKNTIHYDLVMRYRTDCILNEPITKISATEIARGTSFLCIPTSNEVKSLDSIHNQLAWGTPDSMDIYTSIYQMWLGNDMSGNTPEGMLELCLNSKKDILDLITRSRTSFYLVNFHGKPRGELRYSE